MNDALGVRFAQSLGYLVENTQAAIHGNHPGGTLDILQTLAAHQLHGEIENAVFGLIEIIDDDRV